MRKLLTIVVVCVFGLVAAPSFADDSNVVEARALYESGSELGKNARWAEALASFEKSFKLRPHAATIYNVAQCFRAMGQYTRSRAKFDEALAWSKSHGDELPESLAVASNGYREEIDRILVHVSVTLSPADATLAVDGAPLVQQGTVHVAGVAPPGVGAPAPGARFEVVLDPGLRIFAVSRKGFQDVVVRETFAPGATTRLSLEADKLPAIIHVSANRDGSLATIDDVDVGPPPLSLKRSAGTYKVKVHKEGFVPYEAQLTVRAGEEVDLRAPLEPEKIPITKRWWFWTGAVAIVATGALVTYFVTRPAPEPPPYEGGSTGWIVPVK